jgi:hypothetical protein
MELSQSKIKISIPVRARTLLGNQFSLSDETYVQHILTKMSKVTDSGDQGESLSPG